jgi:hypothetical protein
MRFLTTWPARLLLLAGVPLVIWGGSFGADSPSRDKLGQTISNIRLHDSLGKPFRLHDLKGQKAVALVFLSGECPLSNGYVPALMEMAKSYGERGVPFLSIHANGNVTKKEAQELLPLKLFADPGSKAADALGAQVTPEAFVLDADFVLHYRGRIDDRHAARLKPKARVTRHDLRLALDEVLAGKKVTQPATVAIGCPIERTRATIANTKNAPTFYRDVLPILQQHCQTCHRPGEIGPFSFMTYSQARRWAADIKEFTRSRKMPPWKPVAGPAFHGERKLTEQEIATLAAWADGDAPAGDPKDAPPPRVFKDDWQLGKPDLVLIVDKEFQIGPTGTDLYRFFVLSANLKEDTYVSAVEVRPGNRRVVHHAVLFVDSKGRGRQRQERAQKEEQAKESHDRGPGYSLPMVVAALPGFMPQGGLGGWAPGMLPRHLPKGTGYFLPKGADIVLQLHYHRTGKIEKDRTSVGLYFAKSPVQSRMQGVAGRDIFYSSRPGPRSTGSRAPFGYGRIARCTRSCRTCTSWAGGSRSP